MSNKLGPFYCFKSAEEAAAEGWIGGGKDATLFNSAADKCHDFEEELYGKGSLSYATVASLRGATTGGTNFFISGLAQRDNGLTLNDYYQKQSLRVNVGQQIGTRLNVQANTELIHSLTQRGVSGNDNTGINPYTTFSQTPSFIDLTRQGDGTYPKNPQNAVGNSNPLQNAELLKTPENVFRLIGSATGTYNILSAEKQTLDLTMTGGIDAYNDEAKIISPATMYVEQVNANPGTLVLTEANVVHANLNATLGAQVHNQRVHRNDVRRIPSDSSRDQQRQQHRPWSFPGRYEHRSGFATVHQPGSGHGQGFRSLRSGRNAHAERTPASYGCRQQRALQQQRRCEQDVRISQVRGLTSSA